MKGYLVDAGGDVIPQRLHVVDLVFNRQSVKPRRRQWEGISHGTPPEYTTHRVTGCDRLFSDLIRSRLVFVGPTFALSRERYSVAGSIMTRL